MIQLVRWCAVSALCAASCGGASAPTAPAVQISVGGIYDIHKTVTVETCGISSPGDGFTTPGEVRHVPGATTLVVNDHGTRDLPGTIKRDGSFTLAQSRGLVMNTINAVDTFDGGQFTLTGFQLRVTTDLESKPGGGPACRVVTNWAARKRERRT
jgi:hypothetical protein